jgi:hypothetical protein
MQRIPGSGDLCCVNGPLKSHKQAIIEPCQKSSFSVSNKSPVYWSIVEDCGRKIAQQRYADESSGEPVVKASAQCAKIDSGQFILRAEIAIMALNLMDNLNRVVQYRQSSVSGMISVMIPVHYFIMIKHGTPGNIPTTTVNKSIKIVCSTQSVNAFLCS